MDGGPPPIKSAELPPSFPIKNSLVTLDPQLSSNERALVPCPDGTHASQVPITLSLRDLSGIKALKKPPPPIRMLMEVCCLIFHIQPIKHMDDRSGKYKSDYWEPARRY